MQIIDFVDKKRLVKGGERWFYNDTTNRGIAPLREGKRKMPIDIDCYQLANHLRAAACQYHDDGMAIRKQMENPNNIANRAGLQRAVEQFERQHNEVLELANLLEGEGPTAIRVTDA